MSTIENLQEEVRRIVSLPYVRELIPNGDDTWFARIVEFPGCMTEGATQQEALVNLADAMSAWVEVCLEDHITVPQPSQTEFSGKFMVRIPKSLHGDIARRADREGVSLNQYVSTQLARTVGRPSTKHS
jgi:antitoxin HicB